MKKIEISSIKALLFLIDKFNYELDIKYIIDDTTFQSLDEFILNNGQYLLDTIAYINAYADFINRLNQLDLDSNLGYINISPNNSDIYSLEYLESLLEIYNNQKDNYVIANMLSIQRNLLNDYLAQSKILISKLLRILDIYVKLIEYPINQQEYINYLYGILEGTEDESGSSSLEEMLNKFDIVLKNVYGIKKKKVKIKVLTR